MTTRRSWNDRMRTSTSVAVLSLLTTVVAGCGSAAAGTPSGTVPMSTTPHQSALATHSAKAIVMAALRAARREGSVHVRLESEAGGGYIQDDDAGAGSGSQQIRVSSLHMTVRIVGARAYVKVTHTGGEFFVGMAGVRPALYLNRWISYRPGDANYKAVASAGTMASMLSYMKPKGALSKAGSAMISGHPTVGVWGGYLGSRGCLSVSTTGKPLPVRLTVTTVDGSNVTVSFSHWGEPVNITAPANAIPASTLLPSAG
jgi:hypothetical protein